MLLLPALAQARPEFLADLTTRYPAAAQRSCTNCHVSSIDFRRNAFGLQVAAALPAGIGPALIAVEGQDADLDGIDNADELAAGSPPGEGVPLATSPIPTNAFHPAVVHFPIALFLAGVLLDLVGYVRNDRTLLHAGWYNLVLAAVSTFGAMATGVAAMILLDLPFAGLIRMHATAAVVGSAVLLALVALRVHRHEAMSPRRRIVYFVLATVGVALIGGAGHLGGMFVFG